STHFMNEAEWCDRISLMHAGRVLVSDTAAAIRESKGAATLDDAFIAYLQEAIAADASPESAPSDGPTAASLPAAAPPRPPRRRAPFSLRRMLSYSQLEMLQLRRDPIRMTMAMLGSLILMFVIGYGINMDVRD